VCGVLAVEPASQWEATPAPAPEPPGDASAQAEGFESPGARKLDAGPAPSPGDPQGDADLGPGPAPGRDAEGTLGGPPADWPAKWYWPPETWDTLWAVEECESHHGTDPETYNLEAENGGRLQVNRDTWRDFFMETKGWTWEQIVLDDPTNYQAGYIIWERWGRTWGAWSCAP